MDFQRIKNKLKIKLYFFYFLKFEIYKLHRFISTKHIQKNLKDTIPTTKNRIKSNLY
jgi:hypothetical protein